MQACRELAACLSFSGPEWLSPRSWAFPLLAATSQPASSRFLTAFPTFANAGQDQALLLSTPTQAAWFATPGAGVLPPSWRLPGSPWWGGSVHALPRPQGQGPGVPRSAIAIQRQLGLLETLPRRSCRSGSESCCQAGEGGTRACQALATACPPRSPTPPGAAPQWHGAESQCAPMERHLPQLGDSPTPPTLLRCSSSC